MSWKGFAKAVTRIPAHLSKSTGGTTETKDEEFIELETTFNNVDKACRSLSSDAKSLKDGLSMMMAHQDTIAQGFLRVYEPEEGKKTTSPKVVTTANKFAAAMADARQSLAGDLDQIERLIVSPAADIIELLDRIKKLITKRAHKLLDYDDNRTTLQSLREKASRTVSEEKKMAQIEVQYETAAREYESINGILKRDLAVFLGLRQEFVDPILFTYYKYQLKVYQTLYSVYYEIANAQCDLSCTALTGYEIHQSRVAQMLADIKICAASNRTSFQAQNAEHAIVSNGSLNGSNNALPAYTEVPTNYSTAKATQDVTRGMAATSLSALPPPPARRSMEVPRTQYVIALYDFQAQADGDLTFRKDDKIELVERKENVNDWWIGRLGNQIGQFPGNYVKLLN